MQNARQIRQLGCGFGRRAVRQGLGARLCVVSLVCLAVAACTAPKLEPGRWEHPDRPRAEWPGDRSGCLNYADRLAGQALEIRTDVQRSGSQNPSSYRSIRRSIAVEDAKRQRVDLFNACMKGRGYQYRAPG